MFKTGWPNSVAALHLDKHCINNKTSSQSWSTAASRQTSPKTASSLVGTYRKGTPDEPTHCTCGFYRAQTVTASKPLLGKSNAWQRVCALAHVQQLQPSYAFSTSVCLQNTRWPGAAHACPSTPGSAPRCPGRCFQRHVCAAVRVVRPIAPPGANLDAAHVREPRQPRQDGAPQVSLALEDGDRASS